MSSLGYQNHVGFLALLTGEISRRLHQWTVRLLGTSLSLLLDVGLSTTLLGLAGIMLLLIFSLGGLVSRDSSNCAADGTGHTVSGSRTEVGELAASFLLLTFEVLLPSCVLEGLETGMLAPNYCI